MGTPDPTTLWSALNSPFALWFLSSVVLAAITAVFALYKKRQSEQSERALSECRLNTEIGNRIAEGIIAMRLDETRIERGKKFSAGAVYCEALLYLNNRVVASGKDLLDFSTYPDYRLRSFRSLIFELSAVVAQSEVPELRAANAAYEKLVDLADRICLAEDYSQPPDMGKSLAAAKESVVILEHLQKYAPWKSQL